MENVKRYFDHFIGRPLASMRKRIKLWHLEITHGPEVGYEDEAQELADYFQNVQTRKWLRRAWRHHLVQPPKDGEMDYWTHSYHDVAGQNGAKTQLTNAGIRFVLDQYRKETQARREVIMKWATLIFAAVAAAGVIAKF